MERETIQRLYEDIIPKVDEYLDGFAEKNGMILDWMSGDEYVITDPAGSYLTDDGERIYEGEAVCRNRIDFDLGIFEDDLENGLEISIDVFRYTKTEDEVLDIQFLATRKIRREKIGI